MALSLMGCGSREESGGARLDAGPSVAGAAHSGGLPGAVDASESLDSGGFDAAAIDADVNAEARPPECSNVVVEARAITVAAVGAGQGVETTGGLVYVYGDGATGIIREHTVAGDSLSYTGLEIALTVDGVDVVPHPTGLTVQENVGAFLGNTVNGQGTLRVIDWSALLEARTLDGAVHNVVVDDEAVNGTRPELVSLDGRWLLATSDYGESNNEVRLYDPATLSTATYTSDPGVVVHRFSTGTYVQNLHFLPDSGVLVLVQNTSYGSGWKLTFVELALSVASGASVVVHEEVLSLPGELEGMSLLEDGRALFVTSAASENAWFGTVECF